MSRRDHQPSGKIMERLALFGVVAFGLGISYAIHITNKTVRAMEDRSNRMQAEVMLRTSPSETPGEDR